MEKSGCHSEGAFSSKIIFKKSRSVLVVSLLALLQHLKELRNKRRKMCSSHALACRKKGESFDDSSLTRCFSHSEILFNYLAVAKSV